MLYRWASVRWMTESMSIHLCRTWNSAFDLPEEAINLLAKNSRVFWTTTSSHRIFHLYFLLLQELIIKLLRKTVKLARTMKVEAPQQLLDFCMYAVGTMGGIVAVSLYLCISKCFRVEMRFSFESPSSSSLWILDVYSRPAKIWSFVDTIYSSLFSFSLGNIRDYWITSR